jgi:hypothetical protein
MRSLCEALGEVAEEWVVVEGTVEGGIVALEWLLDMDVADVGVEMDDWAAGLGLCIDELARFVFVEEGEVTCVCCWCCDEDDAVGGCCCCCSWRSCCRGEGKEEVVGVEG